MYKIIQTKNFKKIFKKLIPDNLKPRVKKQISKLTNVPFIGKPLSYRFLRELKIEKYRIYYSLFEEKLIILLIGVSDKKLQKETINSIKNTRKTFKRNVENYLKEEKDNGINGKSKKN